jgi:hypothetical protein
VESSDVDPFDQHVSVHGFQQVVARGSRRDIQLGVQHVAVPLASTGPQSWKIIAKLAVPAGTSLHCMAGDTAFGCTTQVYFAGISPPSANPAIVSFTGGGRLGHLPFPLALSWAVAVGMPAASRLAIAVKAYCAHVAISSGYQPGFPFWASQHR